MIAPDVSGFCGDLERFGSQNGVIERRDQTALQPLGKL
jgi:hypothetical protein